MTPSRFGVVLCITGALFLGQADAQSSKSMPHYKLTTVEKLPIPQDEHFMLWQIVALDACKKNPSRYNLTEDDCFLIVSSRANACAAKLAGSAPALITTTAVSKDVGRKYLHCVTPYYFCKGVEVRTEEEVRKYCK